METKSKKTDGVGGVENHQAAFLETDYQLNKTMILGLIGLLFLETWCKIDWDRETTKRVVGVYERYKALGAWGMLGVQRTKEKKKSGTAKPPRKRTALIKGFQTRHGPGGPQTTRSPFDKSAKR